MYARSTTLTADPQRMDDGITVVRDEIMPAVQSMPGCLGLSMLCDRETGRCIVTTSWDSEESMSAARDRVRDMRERAKEAMGGSDMSVDEWEIGALHRKEHAGDGACARVTWTRGDPARVDEALDATRMGLIPQMDERPGFCSMSLFVDRADGRGVLTAVYRDRASMDASRGPVASLREDFTRQMGMEVTEVAEFDLVIHHLRVPEMA